MIRAMEAGAVVAMIAPLVGVFLVLRRYALIADTLSHASLAGVAIGLLAGLSPLWTALGVSVVASAGIEYLRSSKKVYGESALALFLSGSLALAVVLFSVAHGFTTNLFSYLFGSIVTVTPADVQTIAMLGAFVALCIAVLYKELVYVTFDEEAAKVSGIPTRFVNFALMTLSAVVVAIAIPIVGALLISALIVIPAVAALQLRMGFLATMLWAECISLFSVFAGIIVSFSFDITASGAIVLIMLVFFVLISFFRAR